MDKMDKFVAAISLTMLESAPCPIHVISRSFRIWRNEASERVFGELASSAYCYGVFHKRIRLCDDCMVKEVFESRTERKKIRRLGNQVFEVHAKPYFGSEGETPVAVIEYLRDITAEEKQREEIEKQMEEIKKTALLDYVTGVYNQKGLEMLLDQKIAEADRNNSVFCLLMADADNFKEVNDSFGHPVGTKVLAELSKLICEAFRTEDIIARYGGDEFAIVLSGMELAEAKIMAERLSRKVAAHVFEEGGQKFSVTFSIGVAEYRRGMRREDILKIADDALYYTKKGGNNNIVIARGS